jgi:hypothetical protein
MKVIHPYANSAKWLNVDGDLLAYVESLAELPAIKYDERQERYWQDQGLQPEGVDKPGLIPAGEYTDPTTPEAKAALIGLYKALGGTPITRHRVAVALNFRCYVDVDAVRKTFTDEDLLVVDRGGRGRRVRWIVAETPVEPTPEPTPEPEAKSSGRKSKAADKLAAEHAAAS